MINNHKSNSNEHNGLLFRVTVSMALGVFFLFAVASMSYASGGADSASTSVYYRTLRVPSQYGSIQEAIMGAEDGETILVSNGTYYEKNINFYGKDVILKSENGAASTIIDAGSSSTIFNMGTTGTDPIVDGFTLKNGKSDHGGAMKVSSSKPTIKNCIVENNTASYNGGAIYATGSSTVINIENSIFRNNKGKGGAIFLANSGAGINIKDSTFDSNYSYWEGGAILTSSSSVVNIENSVFTNNNGTRAGVIYIGSGAQVDISGSRLNDNSARSWEGGALYINGSADVNIERTEINRNVGSKGGAIFANAAKVGLYDTTIAGNYARSWEGGALYIGSSADVDIIRTVISGSHATRGGGIYTGSATIDIVNSVISGNKSYPYQGGGIFSGGATLKITNSAIVGNQASNSTYNSKGGGIYASGGSQRIENSILWGNYSASNRLKNQLDANAATVVYSDIDQDGYARKNGNIRLDPFFVSSVHYSSAPTTDGDYHLKSGSMLENAASSEYAPNNDIDGDFRPQGEGFDIGPDELLADGPCTGGKPSFEIVKVGEYWSTYHDYAYRNMSVDFTLENVSDVPAYDVRVSHSAATSNVLYSAALPGSMGAIDEGSSTPFTITYQVPIGVDSFMAVIYISSRDACGDTHEYPDPHPEA